MKVEIMCMTIGRESANWERKKIVTFKEVFDKIKRIASNNKAAKNL